MKKLIILIVIIFSAVLILNSCRSINVAWNTNTSTINSNTISPNLVPSISPTIAPTAEPAKKATIMAVGDIMCHYSQVTEHFNGSKYNFNRDFKYIKEIIRSADLALCNFETTLGKGIRSFTGYPMFNSPDEYADAVKFAGFDIFSTANNHSYDTGKAGFTRTVRVLQSKKVTVIGTRKPKTKNFAIKDVNGIKLGFINYTYETNPSKRKALNGIPIDPSLYKLINTFNPSTLTADYASMKKTIQNTRNAGAEAIIFNIHWGNEYQTVHNSLQEKIAKKLSQYGVDIIFGSHPHVLQDTQVIKRANGKKTYVFYSLGNFISNMDQPLTQDGLIAKVIIKKYQGKITIESNKLIPTFTYRHYSNGLKWDILPVRLALSQPTKYNLKGKDTSFLKSSLHRTMQIIK